MKRTITSITAGLFLFFSSLQAQTTCSDDRVAYVNSKNVPSTTGAYTLSIGAEEKASQAYHYSGPGKVGGARVYGDVLSLVGVKLKVSLYNVDANDRPTGLALASAPITPFFAWSASYFDVNFSPAVPISSNFALVVEIINYPGWGHEFDLRYTGNGEGLGEDLASIAGTTTGHNWASAMDDFGKDGDFFIYPRMTHFNSPLFTIATSCVNAGVPVTFSNSTEMTTDRMFNIITQPGYSGTNFLYTWNFGDGSAVSHLPNPSHTYAAAGSYTISLTTTIDGWDLDCSKTYSKPISVGLSVNATSVTNVSCNGGNNGSAVAVGAGGASPYTYSINGESYQTSTSFSGLIAGAYTLYIKDNLGCIKTTSFTITQPSAIHFTSATSTNASCGNADGGILVASSGGIPPMQYQINSGAFQSSGAFTSLSTGAYTVTAKDANGCTYSNIVLVNDVGGPVFSIVNATNVSCYGGNDGTISLSSLGGTGTILYSINGGTTFQASGSFTNVTAGTYTEIVKDAAGCTDLQVVTINQPQQLTLTASAVALTCNGSSNGQINVTSASGGTGAISYSINGISYQSGTNFHGLSAGSYTVYARDVAGCVKTVSVNVFQPSILTATVSVTNAACNNYQDGSITITASGGTPGYTYGIEDDYEYQALSSFGNLAAGTYALIVIDANGCILNTSATINQPTAIAPVATSTNSTCGNSNGGILVIASGGSGSGYTYSLNGGAFGVGTFTALLHGTYVVTAKDGSGCMSAINVTILDSDGPSVVSSSHTNVNCHQGSDGTITVGTVTGGTGALTYSVNGTTYQSSPVFTGLAAGVYDVTVKDVVGCVGNVTITVTEPNAFVITTSVVNELCNGSATGTAAMLVGGGSGTLAYSNNYGSSFQSSNTFTGLAAGNYVLMVKDAGGCIGSAAITITQPDAIHAFYGSLNVTCNGANDGTINVFAYGGTGTLQYSLNGTTYQLSNIFFGLSGGTYSVYVKDANGCVVVITAAVYQPATLAVASNLTDVTCSGGNNGVIDLSISGGTPQYYFDWSNGVYTEDNFNLTAGTYTVIVSDGYGCSNTLTYTIEEPAVPVIVNGTVVNSSGTSNGSIDVTTTGGVGAYTFSWSNGATTEDITGLAPGVYTVIVTDANGCAASSTFVVASAVGIATIDAVSSQVYVYPNPANDYVVIEINGYKMEKVEIYDVLGQIMFTGEPNSSKLQVNTSELSQGVYLVKIMVDNKLITKKMKVIK